MDASIVDLRYKMADVLKALERMEEVNIYSRGELKGTIVPAGARKKTRMKIEDHPVFGMRKDDPRSVEEIMNELRNIPRYPPSYFANYNDDH